MTYSYDRIADIYDDDMGGNTDGQDVGHYVAQVADDLRRSQGCILELGCGTGRITLKLASLGGVTIGLDRSPAMLRRLSDKMSGFLAPRPLLVAADMLDWPLDGQFAAIVCGFSTLTYATDEDRLLGLLRNLAGALGPEGRFHMDVFLADPNLPLDTEIFDYARALDRGKLLERRKVVTRHTDEINRIERRYLLTGPKKQVIDQFSTTSFQRVHNPAGLLSLLEKGGLQPEAVYGDFQRGPLVTGSRVMVISAVRARA